MSILYSVEDGVATLEFDRPERRNALNQAMYAELVRYLGQAAGDEDVRAILVTGQPGVFTAGNELTEFLEHRDSLSAESPVVRFMTMLAGYQKPVVAAVTGHTVGIGVTMLLHCDLVYVAAGARLSMPFTRLGLVPEFAASLLVPMLAGHVRAAEMLMLGTPMSAEEAVQMGFANMAVPEEQVRDVALEAAKRFNALPAGGVAETKRLMKRARVRLVEEAIREEAQAFGARLGSPEVREAVTAFFEKRAADFSRLGRRD